MCQTRHAKVSQSEGARGARAGGQSRGLRGETLRERVTLLIRLG